MVSLWGWEEAGLSGDPHVNSGMKNVLVAIECILVGNETLCVVYGIRAHALPANGRAGGVTFSTSSAAAIQSEIEGEQHVASSE